MEGFAELERNLKALPEKIDKRILRKALKSSANIIGAEAQRRFRALFKPHDTPHVPEGIISDIRIRGSYGGGSRIIVRLGLRISPKQDSVWYGRLLETGWNPGSRMGRRAFARKISGIRGNNIRRLARHASLGRVGAMVQYQFYRGVLSGLSKEGQVPGRPFMAPAFKAKAQQALDNVIRELRAGIEREARRA
jgi:HK97 gp10 family phage protein